MILDNFRKRVVIPVLRRCSICSEQESDHEADHEFNLDTSIPKWRGWYSLLRGVATTLAGLTKDGMAPKGLLRHTNLATTTRHYVKDVPENALSAMNLLESLFNECSTTDVESWLKSLNRAPGTRSKIRNVMSLLFNHPSSPRAL
jgi:hypothetical protein